MSLVNILFYNKEYTQEIDQINEQGLINFWKEGRTNAKESSKGNFYP